jgi:hypothetical protein
MIGQDCEPAALPTELIPRALVNAKLYIAAEGQVNSLDFLAIGLYNLRGRQELTDGE